MKLSVRQIKGALNLLGVNVSDDAVAVVTAAAELNKTQQKELWRRIRRVTLEYEREIEDQDDDD